MESIISWLSNFLNWLLDQFGLILQWVMDLFTWLADWFFYLLYQLFNDVLLGLVDLLSSIPRPDVFAQVESSFCSNFSVLGSVAGSLDIGTPLGIVMGAYVLRFLIRRLPLIG